MANAGDVGEVTCKCGIMYNRFITNKCPLCNLKNKIEKSLKEEYKGDGSNGAI